MRARQPDVTPALTLRCLYAPLPPLRRHRWCGLGQYPSGH